jgi:hypothetical protein
MRSILALDLGTNCGWALRTFAGKVCYGTQSFKVGKYDGGGMRYLKFRNWLDEITPGVQHIAYEAVRRHIGTDAAHVYGGLMATLTAWCEENKIPYEGVAVGTIKKHATGRGNASKDEMIAAANALGYNPEDDNAADALHLLGYVESIYGVLEKAIT